jgi:hypothetical protein
LGSPVWHQAAPSTPKLSVKSSLPAAANRAFPTRSATRASSRAWPSWSAHVEHVTTQSKSSAANTLRARLDARGPRLAALKWPRLQRYMPAGLQRRRPQGTSGGLLVSPRIRCFSADGAVVRLPATHLSHQTRSTRSRFGHPETDACVFAHAIRNQRGMSHERK